MKAPKDATGELHLAEEHAGSKFTFHSMSRTLVIRTKNFDKKHNASENGTFRKNNIHIAFVFIIENDKYGKLLRFFSSS